MRRVLAWLLVSSFSFSLIGPALITDADSDLPACCRRGGQHHCAMADMGQDASPTSGPAVRAHADKCPYFPKGGALLPHADAGLAPAALPIVAATFTQMAAESHPASGYRSGLSRSHQKRGPPVVFS
ncbi:MAG TPA: hypothetical protein VMI94_23220 [Bryobacteraceae bacterium]|nr:hypothetical protein [Bryobacteraceae bacterium]